MNSDWKPSISKVINQTLIDFINGWEIGPLLHLICSNSLGSIIQFIFCVADSFDVFNIQDDDGNTPLHLLCKRNRFLEINYDDDTVYYNDGYNKLKAEQYTFKNISSEPSLTSVFCLLKYLSNYVDFSVKNKDGKTLYDEFHNNIIINNIYYVQMIHKKGKNFPSSKPNFDHYSKCKNVEEWNELFKLKDNKQKNRTLLHYLFMGDRLSAIKFLIDQGAYVNLRTRDGLAISKLFEMKSFLYENGNIKNKVYIRVPSGFNKIPEVKTGNPEDYRNLLYQREKIILEETEKIAEFLIECGTNLTLDNEVPYCDISNIMYRIHQKRDIEKTSVIDKIKNLSKKISDSLMDYSCFPFGNNDRNAYFNSKEVKYIKLESYNDQNQKELEN